MLEGSEGFQIKYFKGGIRMKRSWGKMVAVLALCILVVTSLVGCGSKTSDTTAKSVASDYPNKPIQLILVHKAGSSTDIIARTLQPYLVKELGVQVVVQNVTGGGGTQAMSQLAKGKPDGYTVLMTPFPSATLKQVLSPDFSGQPRRSHDTYFYIKGYIR